MVRNLRSAGRAAHWLIIPKVGMGRRHIRDVEALTREDVPLRMAFPSLPHSPIRYTIAKETSPPTSVVKEMNRIKKQLLKANFPNHSPKEIHSGYHRGRRGLFGPIILPDIVSVHHLHLHVIVEPRFVLRMFKYPSWLRLMWVSDERVMAEAAGRKRPRMEG